MPARASTKAASDRQPESAPGARIALASAVTERSAVFSVPPQFRVVKRVCTVCDWYGYQVEGLDVQTTPCHWCQAPTEIVQLFYDAGRSIAASELGRLGGSKGGRARAAALSVKRRKAIARSAARARWKNRKPAP